MKKQYLFLILIYSVVVLVGVTLVVMDSFNLNFSLVFGNLSQVFHFLFNMFFVVLSLLILLYILLPLPMITVCDQSIRICAALSIINQSNVREILS